MRFEELLHETIDEMSGELRGPSAGLAARSMVKGRRIRRNRRLAATGGAVLAVIAVVLPWAVLSRPGVVAPPPAAAGSSRPQARLTTQVPTPTTPGGLPGGWVVIEKGDQVLERSSGRYISVRNQGQPAPTGDRLLVTPGPSEAKVTDVRGGHPVTVEPSGFIGTYSWSPTGDRLVGGLTRKDPFKVGFGVIDARTGKVRTQWIDADRYPCSRCFFTWTRDGKEIVMAVAYRSEGAALEQVTGLQLFDAETGEPTRSLPVTAMPAGPFAWSPDGRYVVAGPEPGESDGPNGTTTNWWRFDVLTGQRVEFPFAAVWVSDDVLLTGRDGEVRTLTRDGTVTRTTAVGAPSDRTITLGPP
ncbi:hypothetical protein [Dactylosporangium sp. NPDC005555]|uniref:TolB family protein n=1 Tax=Dactylosporangium sp. NPDC005555 TaxID=3154889 RepID=UPI0033B94F54